MKRVVQEREQNNLFPMIFLTRYEKNHLEKVELIREGEEEVPPICVSIQSISIALIVK